MARGVNRSERVHEPVLPAGARSHAAAPSVNMPAVGERFTICR
ncbi:MAG: hypothetical protein OZSIB_2344 [Candidatus Ozemobacter sibiricus]|uniref:Uncharacterized protein n=1 Tax=Candidatus Ozemobacter sibiricus TaxID=2268124 RepID=A0A367ZSZ2_9BACT|nr:MAG: hypothetical protein OZSIB_2344 [Candidatus Ozemobacter sibiricus]